MTKSLLENLQKKLADSEKYESRTLQSLYRIMNVVIAVEIRLTDILCTLFKSPELSAGQYQSR